MSQSPTQRYVFVSYSRNDKEFVNTLLKDFRQSSDFDVWIDLEGLEPGTRNWQSKIREMISKSFSIVLVCSPSSSISNFVQAELELAQKNEIQIIPVWATGTNWVDSIPLGMINYQYIDCRDANYEAGLDVLIMQLRKIRSEKLPKIFETDNIDECPKHYLCIMYIENPKQRANLLELGQMVDSMHFKEEKPSGYRFIAVDVSKYRYMEEILNDIYTLYLRKRYKPYTYGKDWLIARPSAYVSLLAVPWVWLKKRTERALIEVIPNYMASKTPLEVYGFGTKSRWGSQLWAIVNIGFEDTCGLFSSSNDIAKCVFECFTKNLTFILDRCLTKEGETGYFPLAQVDVEKYKHKLVIAPNRYFLGETENTTKLLYPGGFVIDDLFIKKHGFFDWEGW